MPLESSIVEDKRVSPAVYCQQLLKALDQGWTPQGRQALDSVISGLDGTLAVTASRLNPTGGKKLQPTTYFLSLMTALEGNARDLGPFQTTVYGYRQSCELLRDNQTLDQKALDELKQVLSQIAQA